MRPAASRSRCSRAIASQGATAWQCRRRDGRRLSEGATTASAIAGTLCGASISALPIGCGRRGAGLGHFGSASRASASAAARFAGTHARDEVTLADRQAVASRGRGYGTKDGREEAAVPTYDGFPPCSRPSPAESLLWADRVADERCRQRSRTSSRRSCGAPSSSSSASEGARRPPGRRLPAGVPFPLLLQNLSCACSWSCSAVRARRRRGRCGRTARRGVPAFSVALPATTIILASSSPDWTAIAGLASTAVVGVAGIAGTWRRFGHERKLKATDDFLARLDDVQRALTKLRAARTRMRDDFARYASHAEWTTRAEESLHAAVEAYDDALAAIALLGIRSHADRRLVEQADAAAKSMSAAIDEANAFGVSRLLGEPDSEALRKVTRSIEEGRVAIGEYTARSGCRRGQAGAAGCRQAPGLRSPSRRGALR